MREQVFRLMLVCLLWWMLPSYSVEHYRIENYYKNPTLPKLIELLKTNSPVEQQILEVFVTKALNKNPEFIPLIIKEFDQYNEAAEKLLLIGLINNNAKDIVGLQSRFPDLKPSISSKQIEQLTLIKLAKDKNELDKNCANTDYLWAAFYATGDDQYLIKILDYLAEASLIIRTIAYEMINRDAIANMEALSTKQEKKPNYNDLIERAEKKAAYPKEALFSYKIILWSMESNRKNHKDIDDRVQKLIKHTPKLDYREGIKL